MRTVTRVLAASLFAATSLGASEAVQTLRIRIETAMATQAPEWKLGRSTIEGDRIEQSWNHGLEPLSIRCVAHASDAAAVEALNGVMLAGTGGGAIGEIGDAARIWPRWDSSGRTTIYFSRAAFLCDIVAPSPALSRRFAGLVVQEIDRFRNDTKSGEARADQPKRPGSARVYRLAIVLVGMDPFSIEVPVGARVTFVNKDPNFAHDMTSACPEVDAVGRLEPGASGQTAAFTESKTCTYYDRLHPDTPLRRGTIVVR